MNLIQKIKKLFFKENKFVTSELKAYLNKLYEGYPTHYFFGYEKTSPLYFGINNLKQDGIILQSIRKNEEGQFGYRLTGDGLRLVESWNNEKLIKANIIITLMVLTISLIQLLWR